MKTDTHTAETRKVGLARKAVEEALKLAPGEDLSWIQPPPPAKGWPLSPDALRLAVALVRTLRPRHIIELGSGLSTRALARAAAGRKPACAISSADHDPEFGGAARKAFESDTAATAGARVRFQISPIVLRDCGGQTLPVYSVDAGRLASRRPADLVLIDGPPDMLGGREGTLYQMLDFAREGTVVLLDDADRDQEQQAIRHWQENLGPAIDVLSLPGFVKGMAAIIVRRAVSRAGLWDHRAELTARDLAERLPAGAPLILVDDGNWGSGLAPGRTVFPFTERNGEYWGAPEDDEGGIRNLEELRAQGVRFIAFAWPSFWWFEFYARFGAHVRDCYPCVLANSRLMVFELTPGPKSR